MKFSTKYLKKKIQIFSCHINLFLSAGEQKSGKGSGNQHPES